jgi:hypothetical protein
MLPYAEITPDFQCVPSHFVKEAYNRRFALWVAPDA